MIEQSLKYRHRQSSTPGVTPLASNLEVGEIGLNLADKTAFSKDSSNNVFPLFDPSGNSVYVTTDHIISGKTNIYVDTTVNNLPIEVTLPGTPIQDDLVTISDLAGNAPSANITANGNGKLIDGAATFILNTAFSRIELIYDGAEWSSYSSGVGILAIKRGTALPDAATNDFWYLYGDPVLSDGLYMADESGNWILNRN